LKLLPQQELLFKSKGHKLDSKTKGSKYQGQARENIDLVDEFKIKGLCIVFDQAGPGIPQRNGMVEQLFQILYDRIRAMLNGARIQKWNLGWMCIHCHLLFKHISNKNHKKVTTSLILVN
jgi:hypothetical protein